jgi:nitrate reductase / nitrite oxidoreductase, alpha subunit
MKKSRSIFQKMKYLLPREKSADGHQQTIEGGRGWEEMYRGRWSYDKVVRSTHGVNCTGSCSWNVFVKNGIVTWENQNYNYSENDADMPDFEPRGCPRGAAFSWYMYSPLRVKYPYMRGNLAEFWREAKQNHANALEAWRSIVEDPKKSAAYKEARGMGGFVRVSWDEASEMVAASMLYTIEKYGPDRNFAFSPIPAMSMLSYAAGARFMNLMGGACLSFYDWYADLPPASPQVWGDQTDVPESSDWFNAGYIITWGSNVPLTRTPDAHFLTEVRYKGTKVISVSPDYAESTTTADTWLNVKTGTDGAMAMAMGHVILKEYYQDSSCSFFADYAKAYTDFPFFVMFDEKDGEDGIYTAGRFLNAADLGRDSKHAEFKPVLWDEQTEGIVIPNGTMGDRWEKEKKWNIKLEDSESGEKIVPALSVINKKDAVIAVQMPYFGGEREGIVTRALPVKRIQTKDGEKYIATVYDLTLANYGIDRGLGGECAKSYEDDTPFTPAWQEKITGVKADLVIQTAREFADNSIKTKGRSMIIMGCGINHWYHADITYRAVLNIIMFTATQGVNGGGWAHYVGQEKLRPAEGWAAIMSGGDWGAGAKLQNGTSFFYFATEQWRSDEIDTKDLVSPLVKKPRYRHSADYNVLAARLGWLPSYPTFNKSGGKIAEEAAKEGYRTNEEIQAFVARQLKNKDLKFAIEDPAAEENFPRNLIVWRSNLITSSSKGHEYFLKYLLGTKNGLFEEEESAVKPEEVKWRDDNASSKGKLDLLVNLDFRMAGTALYSDIVLPAATWYEKTDMSSTDMHPFIHPFQPAVDSLWESKTDWEIFKVLGKAVSDLAKEVDMPEYQDVMSSPIQHDSEGETAQPLGKVRDWSKGDCEPIPGKTMPNISVVKRDYKKIYEKQIGLGPNVKKNGFGTKGVKWKVEGEYEELGRINGVIQDEKLLSHGLPDISTAYNACQAVLHLSSASNGSVAVRAWEKMEEKAGVPLKHLASGREAEKFTFEQIVAQPRQAIPTPLFTGANKDGRRYSPFTTNIEEKLPFRTITGRQSYYLDHEMMLEWGENLANYKPILDYMPLKREGKQGDVKEITLKYLTPHNKWSVHSMYFDNQQMLTLFRGGQSVWLNVEDAEQIGVKDNDWLELYNRNGVVASRAVVTPRMPRGMVYMHHAQDRHINVPGSKLSKTRGGTHNTPTHIHVKPTHMIGGYGQLSYGFNYYGPTGNQRDVLVVVRKMEEVDWLED